MFLLKNEVEAARHAVTVFRAAIAVLDGLIGNNSALAPLADWSAAINEKIDAFAQAIQTGDGPRLPAWHSGTFAEQIRADPRLTRDLAISVLSQSPAIRAATNAVIAELSGRLPSTLALLTLFGGVVADFVSIESALYGCFPELEPVGPDNR